MCIRTQFHSWSSIVHRACHVIRICGKSTDSGMGPTQLTMKELLCGIRELLCRNRCQMR